MTTPVDSGFADWLKRGALYLTAAPTNAAQWPGAKGVATEIVSPFATRAAALIEAGRQAEFLKGPNVRENVTVKGARKDLIGRAINLTGDRLGYSSAATAVFVLGAQEQDNGTTVLTVLRRL